MAPEIIIALIGIAALFVASAVCFGLLMDEVTTTDEHDALFGWFK
jgi:hypothetical protein